MPVHRATGRVAGHERSPGDAGDMLEASVGEVADVDDHAQRLHAPDWQRHRCELSPAPVADFTQAVGEHRAPVPGEAGHAHAESPERVDDVDIAADRLHALEGKHHRDATALDDGVHLVGGGDECDIVTVLISDRPGRLDQAQGTPQRALTDELLLSVDRQHLQDHATPALSCGSQKSPKGSSLTTFLLMDDAHQQIVVAIRHGQRHGRGHRGSAGRGQRSRRP